MVEVGGGKEEEKRRNEGRTGKGSDGCRWVWTRGKELRIQQHAMQRELLYACVVYCALYNNFKQSRCESAAPSGFARSTVDSTAEQASQQPACLAVRVWVSGEQNYSELLYSSISYEGLMLRISTRRRAWHRVAA